MADNQLGGQIEHSVASGVDSLSSCGMGTMILFLLLLLACAMIVYLSIRNARTVDMVLKQLLGGDHGQSDKDGN